VSTVVLDFASPGDDKGIRALVGRQAMPGRIRLALAREPDFSRGCLVTGDDHQILVARSAREGEVVGVACRSVRRLFLNGREQRVGYLGQLRVDERFRGRWLVSRGFSLLERIHRDDPLPAYLASIVEGNNEAFGVLVTKRRRSFPAFREVARYRTMALSLRRARRTLPGAETIVPGTKVALGDLVQFLRTEGARRQLFPAWTEDDLHNLPGLGLSLEDVRIALRAGAIVGVMALWDQSAYKQTVVRGYSGWLRALTPILPRAGTIVRSAYASMVCVLNDDARVFGRLLRDIYSLARARGFQYLLVGLDARDPKLAVARAYPHYSYPTRLYLARWPDETCHEDPDARLVYVDIATL
jgi:hypothetical protein